MKNWCWISLNLVPIFLLNTLELGHSELLFDRLRTLRDDALHKDSGMTHVRLLFVAEKKTEKEKKLPM